MTVERIIHTYGECKCLPHEKHIDRYFPITSPFKHMYEYIQVCNSYIGLLIKEKIVNNDCRNAYDNCVESIIKEVFSWVSELEKDYLKISIKEKLGLDTLLKMIESSAKQIAGLTEMPHITRQRQRYHIEQALAYLENFHIANDLVLATEDIRMVIRSLSNVTGKITIEEILGEIFSNFCIGK